jgi:hypothetical protein
MTDYGLKISKAGYDVNTASDDELLISSKFPMFKVIAQGTFDLKIYKTTLNGALNSSATTVTVASTTGFPSAGYIWIYGPNIFEFECIEYTSKNATQFLGCSRHFNGTQADSHLNGASVFSGHDQIEISHGLTYPPVHFVFNTVSTNKVMCPRPAGFDPANYIDAYTTNSLLHVSIELTAINSEPTILPSGTYNQYDFSYMIMGDSITDPYY